MRLTPILLMALAAISPRWEPAGSSVYDARLEGLREELAGVQMELMDVMRTDPSAVSRLRGREEELEYELRAEQIRLHDAGRSGGSHRS